MRQEKNIIKHNWMVIIAMIFLLFCTKNAEAQEDSTIVNRYDSIEISLLTCGPFDQIYALYGHTGLRINDLATGQDIVANWGIFDMTQSFFAVKFAFGITDYRMAFETMNEFCVRYYYFGTSITEQVLNLSAKEKQQVLAAVNENAKPENLYYRYNYFYDNCTTRVRDIIANSVDGKVVYPKARENVSFRRMIHEWNDGHHWEAWGNDFLLGLKADKPTTKSEQQFLPDVLRSDFDHTVIIAPDGTKKPMVKELRYPIQVASKSNVSFGFWNTWAKPYTCLIILVVLIAAVMLYEMEKKVLLWQLDAALFTVLGIIGLILFAMIFSQHPTVSLNLQILIFNPLYLIFVVPMIKAQRKSEICWQSHIICLMLVISIFTYMLKVQIYAEGVFYLALLLLVFIVVRHLHYKDLGIYRL